MATIKFKCPGCGSDDGLFRASREVKSYDDLIGASCAACGHNLTDEEVKRQAVQIPEEAIAKAFKSLGC